MPEVNPPASLPSRASDVPLFARHFLDWVRVTDRSLASLRAAGVPEAVLAKLVPLKDNERVRKEFLDEELAATLDKDERKRFADLVLQHAQRLGIRFFARMKTPPKVGDYPGTLRLRFFGKGEVICRQGDAGWSAFYALPDAEALEVLRLRLQEPLDATGRERLQAEVNRLQALPAASEARAADVYLAVPRPAGPARDGWLSRLGQKLIGRASAAPEVPLFIPFDGPTDISYESRHAIIKDSELFGEMSCLYGRPRSATVVASRDIYVVEMLRNILDLAKRDKDFQDELDRKYRARVLEIHLSGLAFFRGLSEEHLGQLRDNAELVRFRSGDVICDENERSDGMYVIRSGLVKVLKNASALLAIAGVRDWTKLLGLLRESGPAAALGKLLPQSVRSLLDRADAALQPAQMQEVVHGLNEVIKNNHLPDLKEFKALADSPELAALRKELPKRIPDCPTLGTRQFNRLLLEAALPGALAPWRLSKGPLTTLAYVGRGEFFGETGLMLKRPRNATCVAYVHPVPEGSLPVWFKQGGDLVELVRIKEETFWQLVNAYPTLKANVEKEIARQQAVNVRLLQQRTWDDPSQLLLSEDFSRLGLVQGQKLMLIDLDRCTRCDECVQACVHTHTDGRSRLFLDGPRFGKFLVPTTCRSCLEPVCMVGCPVGSIQRGDNRQIIIRDWCIGCGLCARNCSYGSIQMHDIGLVSEGALDWHIGAAETAANLEWTQPGYHDATWLTGQAPFYEADLQARFPQQPFFCFRRDFLVDRQELQKARQFILKLTSTDGTARVWINGLELQTTEKVKADGSRKYSFARQAGILAPGRNVVAVLAKREPGKTGTLFDLGLTEEKEAQVQPGVAGEFTETSYGKLAVVCDLCSEQYGQRPACVTACPHDAALRVDARFEFPVQ
jgi:Fe-S-cluster-containing hydrogenase component 2/CRP-like cAMP-binding protein